MNHRSSKSVPETTEFRKEFASRWDVGAHAASTAQLETFLKAAPRAKPVPAASLDDKKRSLLQLFVDDALADDDDDLDLGPADAP